MNSRLKIFGVIAILGFLAGIIAQLTATYVIPWLALTLPTLASLSSYLVAGFAGAVITVTIVGVWAYMTSKRDPY